jgi:uncharacterized membrane protein YgcG
MRRKLITVFLVIALTLLGTQSDLVAQYGGPQPYPQAPAYPQTQSPQAGYPQAQYPQYGQPEQGNQASEAQDTAADRQHGVARISIVQGDVNVKRSDNGELVAAAMNAPVVTRDRLQTGPGSRAEVELDSADLVRLAPNTDLGFADLEYRRYQMQLGAGTILYRVLRPSDAQAEVDTPSIAIRPVAQGEYRISVLDDGTTQITVRSGQLEIDGPRGSQRLDPGHTTLVRGDPSDPEYQTSYEIARDQFDDWSAQRDRELLASQSYQYVSPDINGADDLDTYGKWVPSQYGQVWAPQPPVPDWSPYSYGHWAWVDYYGWTWIDYAPWGWAPYHYGRWFRNGGFGWCWWPGPRIASVFWSPALVGFFGWGGFGLGWAGLGWVALAPFEVFHAWWGHGFYGRGGYEFARGDIGRIYRNAAIRGGAMTAPYNGFGGLGQHFSPANRGQLANASLFRGQMPVSPARGSFQFSNRPAIANPRLAAAASRPFFQARQGGFTAAGQRGFNAPSSSRGVPPNMQGGFTSRPSTPRPSAGGWQRFGDPGSSNGVRQGFMGSEPKESTGWHHFGQPEPHYYGPPAPRYSAPSSPRYSAPSVPRYSAPSAPRYSTPSAPHYSTPSAPHFSPPSPQRYSAPHSSAPSVRGGGGSRGGGGGGSHGGGGGHSGGGHHGR